MKEFVHLSGVVRPLKGCTPADPRGFVIDNFRFRCHYQFTFALLLVMTALASSRSFVNNISCSVEASSESVKKAIETYCFFKSAFLHPETNSTAEREEWIYPGVGPDSPGQLKVHFVYYQWVPYLLFFQALTFYAPYYAWKNLEGGRIKAFISPFRAVRYGLSTDEFPFKFISKDRLRAHRDWAKWLVLCELWASVNVVFNIWLTNVFLRKQFFGLGFTWMSGELNALNFLFPRVTKCIFYKFGPSGSVRDHDAICVMGLNYIYEKIYCILWFWFFGLIFLELVSLIWRTIGLTLHSRCYLYNRVVWDFVSERYIETRSVQFLSKMLCYSDWLLLYYLGKNLDGRTFCLIVGDLSEDFGYRVVERCDEKNDIETD